MKLASLNTNEWDDGELCVVNRNLTQAAKVGDIAPTLQYALDHWEKVEPKLQAVYQALNQDKYKEIFAFNSHQVTSPLPRAYQWADGSAYVNHVELVRKARGAEMPQDFWTNPLVYQGGSDHFWDPTEPIAVADLAYGVDFEAEIAIITDRVPMAIKAQDASQHIKLIMLVNDVSFRNLIPGELAKGFGFFQSKPASTFSPVAITPDELGEHWDGARVHLPLRSSLNGGLFGEPNAGEDMTFSFPELIAHIAKTRFLGAGTIIGSGTVSNRDRSKGSSCLVEKRMLETLADGAPKTPYMTYGDVIRIEMFDQNGQSLFGAIEQTIVPYEGAF